MLCCTFLHVSRISLQGPMRVRNGFDETSRRERRLLFSKAFSSFPKRKPGLRFGFLFSKLVSSFPKRKPGLRFGFQISKRDGVKTIKFQSRYVTAISEQTASFSSISFPTHGKRCGRRRHVGRHSDRTNHQRYQCLDYKHLVFSRGSFYNEDNKSQSEASHAAV